MGFATDLNDNLKITGASDSTDIGNVGDRLKVDATFSTYGANVISTANSRNTNLAGNAVFTGTAEDMTQFGIITVSVYSSHAGSMTVQWSHDGTNWRADGDNYAVTATTLKTTTYGPKFRFFRVVYTNGAVTTTTLNIETTYRNTYEKPSSHKISEAITDDFDSELVKAVLTGRMASGTYGNAKLTSNSELMQSDIADNGGSNAALTVGTTAVLANVSGTNLANRKSLTVYNNGSVLIYWGHSNTVTTSSGTPIVPGERVSFGISANTNVYLISGTASQNTRITEMA